MHVTRCQRSRRSLCAVLVAVLAAGATVTSCSGNDAPGTARGRGTDTASSTTASIGPGATTTIPDLGDVTGPVGDCLKLAGRFSNLVQGMLEGPDGARRSQKAAEQMKSELPESLHDDADVVARTFGQIADHGGQVDGADVDESAYKAAVEAFGRFFSDDCRT